jgi:hypothetical protein
VETEHLLGGPLEAGAIADRPVDECLIESKLEDHPDALDFVPERHRTTLGSQGAAEVAEVLGSDVR